MQGVGFASAQVHHFADWIFLLLGVHYEYTPFILPAGDQNPLGRHLLTPKLTDHVAV